MATEDFSEKFKGLKIKESQDINILLLGETGVGKSTFINAVANYFHFKSFKKASKAENLLVLIPSVITVSDNNFEQKVLKIGSENQNEYQEIGAAGTQDVKTYVFPIGEGKTRLRLIDSPGMGDPRGVSQDDVNCENILAYLSQLKELHAICFLMKPTTTRITVLFDYCVKQILSRLEKSASQNIVFIFTNSRGTDYTPGDTLPCLRSVINDIKAKPPHVDIPLKDNIFSLDNEAFRILAAMKQGINFTEEILLKFIESWNNSSKECWRLISYIVGDASRDGVRPHQLYNTMSINEARRVIVQLSQPLADITQLIHDNIRILDRHRQNLNVENQSLDELKRKLYIPIINLEVTQLTQPVTVCTSPKCAKLFKVGNIQKWHYSQRCHDPCYLTCVTKEIVGDLGLKNCAAMNGGRICTKCTCDFSVHMHVYYLTKTVDDRVEDKTIKDNIHLKEEALRESRRLIDQIDERKRELENEREVIVKSTAQFAHFLQHNAISPFNDSYQAYIEYLITREQSLGRQGDPAVIYNLEQLLDQYKEMKDAFERSLEINKKIGSDAVSTVTAESVMKKIHQLYQLKHNGKKIHELFKKQKSSRSFEYDKNCEYVHPKSSDPKKEKKSKPKDAKASDSDNKKKKDGKKKDGKNTDDERKYKNKGPNDNQQRSSGYQQRFSGYQQQRFQNSHYNHYEPPPPYEGVANTHNRGKAGFSSKHNQDNSPNVVVKVELGQPKNDKKRWDNRNKQSQPWTDNASGYSGPGSSYGPHQGPPGSYQGPNYYGSYQGGPNPHHGPPQQYQGPPSQYPQHYQGPPQHYQGPPQQYQAQPQGQYYPPQQGGYYGPPAGPGPYYPPQGSYYRGSQDSQGHYQRQHSGQGNQGNKSRGQNKGGRSKPRNSKDNKSGNEKSEKSSKSDSSSD